MFKKILSVLLCAVLILSTIIGTVTANDDAVLNLDFENYPSGGALNKFKIADTGDTAQGKALYGNFTAADANASPAAALMTSTSDAKVETGATYEVSLKYKAVNLNSTFAYICFMPIMQIVMYAKKFLAPPQTLLLRLVHIWLDLLITEQRQPLKINGLPSPLHLPPSMMPTFI